MARNFTEIFFAEAAQVMREIRTEEVERLAEALASLREGGGRLFLLGVGGGAGHASHAAADFRKLCSLEAYSATDNVSEFTARTNDEGWDSAFKGWLESSRLGRADGVMVFSVGGGSIDPPVSTNLVAALEYAGEVGATRCGIVGHPGGATARLAEVPVLIKAPADRRTFHVEAFQAVIWHLLVTHPRLAKKSGRWESLAAGATEST
jgi:D-sedoheptulose 7-phosphate isomerase